MGNLTAITGGMFAGKSSELERIGERYEIAKQTVIYFKPETDTRSSENIRLHSGNEIPAYSVTSTEDIALIVEREKADVILIDEVQFFQWSPIEILKIVTHLTMIKDLTVFVSGLDMDFRGIPFKTTAELLALADSVTKLQAVCSECGKNATHSYRFHGSDEVVEVGADESYTALCRNCYIQKIRNQS